MPEELTLGALIAWLLSGGGSGVVAFFLMEKVKFLAGLAPDYKRYASLGITAAVALAAWGIGLGMKYIPIPGDPRSWVESVFSIVAVAIAIAQTIHGATSLRRKRLNGE